MEMEEGGILGGILVGRGLDRRMGEGGGDGEGSHSLSRSSQSQVLSLS